MSPAPLRLPHVPDLVAYDAIWADDQQLLPVARSLALERGLTQQPERYPTGTAVAYRMGDAVLKLYPPQYASDAVLESEVLTRAGAVPLLRVPRVIAQGERDSWSYLLMTRLAGTPVEEVSRTLPTAVFHRLMEQLGAALRRLHAVSSDALPRPDADWRTFRAQCGDRAVDHHIARGVSEVRRSELEQLLADLRDCDEDGPMVLLHTELGPGHVLTDGAQLTGIFDFGEARQGPASFDFAAVGLFITRGDRHAFKAFLDGYGLSESERGDALVRRVFRHALLHPYGHLTFYLTHSPVPETQDFASMAGYWFAH